jgi:hypothetical protein
MTKRAHGVGLLLAAAAVAVLLWDVERPALWLDEAASVVATQRTWPDLWQLRNGADAPLVPYYAMLELLTSGITGLNPGTAARPELLFRLPSLVAAALAVWVLAFWLTRRYGVGLALSSGTALLVTSGFSRYGQEARPYAFVLLAAVISTAAWARMVSDPRRRWVGGYAVSVALLATTHLLAGSLVVAHLVAALAATRAATAKSALGASDSPAATSGWPSRRASAGRTLSGAGLGLAVAAPFAVPASSHAVGPTKAAPLTAEHLSSAFISLFTNSAGLTGGPVLGIGVVLILAAIGLPQVLFRRYSFVARLAAAWALVPPLVLLPVVATRPNLVIGRYLIFVIPGWAILAGLGVVTVVQVAHRLSGRNAVVRAVSGSLTSTAVLTAMIFTQVGTLNAVRTPGGHSEDIRPALASADRPEYATLPIVMTSLFSSLELSAYHRADEHRLVGQSVQRDQASVWPIEEPDMPDQAGRHRQVVLLLRAPSPARCRERSPGPTLDYVRRCMPKWLKEKGYRVESAHEAGHRWTFAVLTRRADRSDQADRPTHHSRPRAPLATSGKITSANHAVSGM